MPTGLYVRRYGRNDKNGMYADLEFGTKLLRIRGSMSDEAFMARYQDLQLEDSYAAQISLGHALTLMEIAAAFRNLPEHNKIRGLQRLLSVLTITEAKELALKSVSNQDRLKIIEAVEAGKLSHNNVILGNFVRDLRRGVPFHACLERYSAKSKTDTLPVFEMPSLNGSSTEMLTFMNSMYRTLIDFKNLALMVANQAEQAADTIYKTAQASNIPINKQKEIEAPLVETSN